MAKSENRDLWTVRGVLPETRERVAAAAGIAKQSIGEYVNITLLDASCSLLKIPAPASVRPVVETASLELVTKVSNLEARIQKLEKIVRNELHSDDDDTRAFLNENPKELLQKLLLMTGPQPDQLQSRVVRVLMEALMKVNDPWLTYQLRPLIENALAESRPRMPLLRVGTDADTETASGRGS